MPNNTRRKFLKNGLLASASFAAPAILKANSFYKENDLKLTILHTNDVHSRLEPFPQDGSPNAGLGGVAARAEVIKNIRNNTENILLLDAGDIFQGTPYFNYYGGEIEFKLMSMMKYDLATIGNHDFDNSIEGLYNQLPNASFEFVNSNYDFKNTIMDGHVKPYKIVYKDGIKVGVFGIGIELEGLVDKKNYKETVYNDPVSVSQDMARILKQEEKCDLVICLSHIGYQYKNEPNKISDIRLATLTKDIDLIIGGHTHTFLDKPTIIKNADGKDVLVNQVGCYGVNLGRIDFYFDSDVSKIASGKSIIV